MNAPDAVLFDLDGTIVDSRRPYARCMNYALTSVGLPPIAPEQLFPYLGPPLHETLLDHLVVPPELVDRCVELYRERYREHGLAETEVFAGVPELLRDLHGRVPLALATSKVITLARPLLELLDLAHLFTFIAAPDPEVVNEPKSATIAAALRELREPAHAVMIGDRMYDVRGAQAHGISTIGVLWGAGSEQELREAGAAALVRRPDEIPALLGIREQRAHGA